MPSTDHLKPVVDATVEDLQADAGLSILGLTTSTRKMLRCTVLLIAGAIGTGDLVEELAGETPTAHSLVDQLPLILEFSALGGEVIAEPMEPVTLMRMPCGFNARARMRPMS